MANVSAEPHADWRVASQLLQAGEYQQVADWLQTAQGSLQGENPLLALLAASVQQIALACWQCRADREWHEQARVAAQSREEILRHQAESILSGITAQASAVTADTDTTSEPLSAPPTITPPRLNRWSPVRGLLQQMRHLFGSEEEESAPEPVTPPLAAEAVVPPPSEPPSAPLSLTVTEITEPVLPAEPAEEPAPAEAAVPVEPALAAPVEPSLPPPTPQPVYDLAFSCLGSFRVYQRDQLIEEWNGLKGQMILKYLAVQRGVPVTKDRLMDIFWPDSDPEAARRNLHQAIYSLRQTLRRRDPTRQHIHFENNQYLLNPELSVWVDSQEFVAEVQTGRRLEAAGEIAPAMAAFGRAEGLYQGDFLAEDLYEEWPRGQRERLRSSYLEIADHLSEYYLQQGEFAAASALCHKILSLDNCFEAAHRRLMRCYLAQGQRHLAIRQYHTCVQTLATELDVPPDEATQALYASITAHSAK